MMLKVLKKPSRAMQILPIVLQEISLVLFGYKNVLNNYASQHLAEHRVHFLQHTHKLHNVSLNAEFIF